MPVLMEMGGDAVYSSPYLRAVNTARPLAARLQRVVQIGADLRERALSPVSLTDWRAHLRHSFVVPAFALAGGESMEQARKRGLSALAAISVAGHACPVLVLHGNLIASLLAGIAGRFGFEDWAQMANPDVFILTLKNAKPTRWVRPRAVG